MKYVGILLILIGAAVISREYAAHMKKRIRECEEFLEFIGHIRTQLSCHMCPANELGEGFSASSIRAFTELVYERGGMLEAFLASVHGFSLSEEETGILSELFSSIGKGSLEDELKCIDQAYERLEDHLSHQRESGRKNIRLVSVLSVTGALGFLMLVV